MNLETCASEFLMNKELVAQWNRLRPEFPITVVCNLPRSPIARMVDDACGLPPVLWSDETKREFFAFVSEYVLRPVLAKMEEA